MNKRVMFVFPGQGAQYPGMLGELCEKDYYMEWLLEKEKQIVGKDIAYICDALSEDELKRTENSQLALFFVSYCQYKWLRSHYEVEPIFFAGHSLGEISALTCSGALTIEDGLKLVSLRGRYMSEVSGSGKMAAVFDAPEKVVNEVCTKISNKKDSVCIANYNSNKQLIISGADECVEKAVASLNEKGYRCVMLKVQGAFHSKYMQSAADKLKPYLKELEYGIFEAPVISNVTAKPYCSNDIIEDNLYNQIISPVLWNKTIEYAIKSGVELFVEVGPGHVIKGLIKQITDIPVLSIGDESDRNRLSSFFKFKNEDKNLIFLVQRCLGISVCEKNKNFDEEMYQKGVIDVYNNLTALKDKCIATNSCSIDDAETAIKYMIQILRTKGVDNRRINARINQLLRETNTEVEFCHLILV